MNSSEELKLINFLSGMSSLGYSRTVKQVIEIVQSFVDKKGLDVTVSSSWWKSFRSPYKNLTLRNPETLTHARVTGVSDVMPESYFDLLEMTLIKAKLMERPW